jgi:hypothetical protein
VRFAADGDADRARKVMPGVASAPVAKPAAPASKRAPAVAAANDVAQIPLPPPSAAEALASCIALLFLPHSENAWRDDIARQEEDALATLFEREGMLLRHVTHSTLFIEQRSRVFASRRRLAADALERSAARCSDDGSDRPRSLLSPPLLGGQLSNFSMVSALSVSFDEPRTPGADNLGLSARGHFDNAALEVAELVDAVVDESCCAAAAADLIDDVCEAALNARAAATTPTMPTEHRPAVGIRRRARVQPIDECGLGELPPVAASSTPLLLAGEPNVVAADTTFVELWDDEARRALAPSEAASPGLAHTPSFARFGSRPATDAQRPLDSRLQRRSIHSRSRVLSRSAHRPPTSQQPISAADAELSNSMHTSAAPSVPPSRGTL